jgi:hypothetical protein
MGNDSGRMAFVRTPDGISIELLQAGEALAPAEPWTSMANTGSWQSMTTRRRLDRGAAGVNEALT